MQMAGVTDRGVAGVGATPVRCTYRVGFAALVAPTPATPSIQQISSADTKRICAAYETYLPRIHGGFTNDNNFIYGRTL